MKILDVKSIVDQFEQSGEIMYRATLDGDYKTNNKEGTKLIRLFKRFEKNADFADACISALLKSKNVVVRTKAAAYCLSLRMNVEQAEEMLIEIGNDSNYGIFSFNAQMTYKVWKEQGFLQIYQGQEIKR